MAGLPPENEFHPENRISKYFGPDLSREDFSRQEGSQNDTSNDLGNDLGNDLRSDFILPESLEELDIFTGITQDHPHWRSEILSEHYSRAKNILLNLLKIEMTPAIQTAVVQTLQGTKDPEVVAEIVKIALSRSTHQEIRLAAVKSLKGTHDHHGQVALAKLISSVYATNDYFEYNSKFLDREGNKYNLISAAAASLKGTADTQAIRILTKAANPNPFVLAWRYAIGVHRDEINHRRGAAALALSDTRNIRTHESLIPLLLSKEKALSNAGIAALSQSFYEPAELLIHAKLAACTYIDKATRIGNALKQTPNDRVRALLTKDLFDSKPSVQIGALTALTGTNIKSEVKAISLLMETTKDPLVYEKCIAALSKTKVPEGEETLVKHLEKSKGPFKIELLEALEDTSNKTALNIMFENLTSDDASISRTAQRVLQGKDNPEIQNKLLGMFELGQNEETAFKAAAAAEALKKVPTGRITDSLCDRLEKGKEFEQILAATALHHTTDKRALLALLRVACGQRYSNDVRYDALSALSTFEGDIKTRRIIERRLSPILTDQKIDREVKIRVIQTLEQPEHPAAIYSLLKLASGKDLVLRFHAVLSLRGCPSTMVQDDIAQCLKHERDLNFRASCGFSLYNAGSPDAINTIIETVLTGEAAVKAASISGLNRLMKTRGRI